MYICKKCGQTYATYNPYCSVCGGVIAAIPQANPTSPSTPTTTTYAPYGVSGGCRPETKPTRPKVTRGTMLMGVFGFIFAVSSWFGVSIAEDLALKTGVRIQDFGEYFSSFNRTYRYQYLDQTVFTVTLFVYILMSVLGFVLSAIARKKGFSGLAVAGKIISIVGIVLNTILFCLALSGEIVTFKDIFHFDF